MNADMAAQVRNGQGFIAALDQSGGSTPKALAAYGVREDQWSSEDEMFDLIHQMRARIVAAPAFTGEKVVGAILFQQTLDREFGGEPAAKHLWETQGVVPFLKIDNGLKDEVDGVQLMKPMPDLGTRLPRAHDLGVFGTKERSVIHLASPNGIERIVQQQFEVGREVLGHDMMPILEPEISIKAPDKQTCEDLLLERILAHLETLDEGQEVMLKLTLPETPGHYQPLIDHPKVMRVVALSGGYDQDEATRRLSQNPGMIASFSRALAEGLSADQSDEAFNDTIGKAIDAIYQASVAG